MNNNNPYGVNPMGGPMGGPMGNPMGNPMAWSGGAGNMDIGFADWMKKKHPELAGSFFEKLGLMKPNQQLDAQNMKLGMSGMIPPQPAMNMQQLMQMARGRPQMAPPPQGLMAPPQKGFKGTGLWG
jgi:hypothetical protein